MDEQTLNAERVLSLNAGATAHGVTFARLQHLNLLAAYFRAEVIDELVRGVELPTEEADRIIQDYCRTNRLPGPEALEQIAPMKGLSVADLIWQILLPRRIARLAWERYHLKAEQRFLERKTALDQVVYSLLRVKDADLARELFLRLQEGETTFADLAAQLAEGPEQKTNGIIGPVPLTKAHPVLAERLRTLQPGELAEPLSVAGWVLLVRLERFLPAVFDQGVAQQMCHEQLEQWVQERTSARLAQVSAELQVGATQAAPTTS